MVMILILKQSGIFFQNVILDFFIVPYNCNIYVWNLFMNIQSALWILMAWCFSTMQGISSYNAKYVPMHFQLSVG